MENVVSVKNLTIRFGNFLAVDDVTFDVKGSEIFGFLGPNGAGKSTTIKTLCGIVSPSSGEGYVAGYDIMNSQDKIKNEIGYMSQKFSLYGDLTVKENLEFFGSIYGLAGKKLKDRIGYVLSLAEIRDRANMLVKNLPGGIKQRLALGSAIIHDPKILFLDEPTSGVSPEMRRIFWEQIYKFSKEGKTIFVTTHYMDEAEHCDRIALLISGKIIALDSPRNLKKEINYDIYSLKTDKFMESFDYISKLEFLEEVSIFGSDLHLLCKKGFLLKGKLKEVLASLKIKDYILEKVDPSLEDVFIDFARRKV